MVILQLHLVNWIALFSVARDVITIQLRIPARIACKHFKPVI
jgi:hypothetical protein